MEFGYIFSCKTTSKIQFSFISIRNVKLDKFSVIEALYVGIHLLKVE